MIARVARTIVVRLALTMLVVLVLTGGAFAIHEQLPTDPAHFLNPDPHATTRELAPFNHKLGTDRPVLVQYGDYLWHAARLDFGLAWTGIHLDPRECPPRTAVAIACPQAKLVGASVRALIWQALSVTASLVAGGALLLVLIAVPLGLLAASKPRSWIDRMSVALVLLGVSTHPLVVGVVLQVVFGKKWHLAPAVGYCTIGEQPQHDPSEAGVFYLVPQEDCHGARAWASHLVLPWVTFALFFSAIYMRMLRSSTIDTLREQYIATARAKGASERRVLVRHALPNALLPVLTMLAMDAGLAIGVAIYIETVYGLPGIGLLARTAFLGIVGYDRPLIVGLILTVALVVMLFNALVNSLYAVIDPRTAEGRRASRRSRPVGGLV